MNRSMENPTSYPKKTEGLGTKLSYTGTVGTEYKSKPVLPNPLDVLNAQITPSGVNVENASPENVNTAVPENLHAFDSQSAPASNENSDNNPVENAVSSTTMEASDNSSTLTKDSYQPPERSNVKDRIKEEASRRKPEEAWSYQLGKKLVQAAIVIPQMEFIAKAAVKNYSEMGIKYCTDVETRLEDGLSSVGDILDRAKVRIKQEAQYQIFGAMAIGVEVGAKIEPIVQSAVRLSRWVDKLNFGGADETRRLFEKAKESGDQKYAAALEMELKARGEALSESQKESRRKYREKTIQAAQMTKFRGFLEEGVPQIANAIENQAKSGQEAIDAKIKEREESFGQRSLDKFKKVVNFLKGGK